MRDVQSRVAKLEQSIGSPSGCVACKDYDGLPLLGDAVEEQAALKEYSSKAEKPEDAIHTVAYKVPCNNCQRPYIQIVHVVYVGGRYEAA